MDTQTSELVALVENLATELDSYGENHWANWLRKDVAWIRSGNPAGIAHLLAAYGGMGSMNDMRLSPESGHPIAAEHVDAINASMRRRTARVYELVRVLHRDEARELHATA